MAFKIVVSDNKESHQIEVDTNQRQIIGLAIGDELSGDLVGLEGYTLKITGGSDKNGFPMKKDVEGPRRIRSLLAGGVGYKSKAKGVKRRKTLRGNTISEDIVQINTIVSKAGKKSINAILNPESEPEVEAVEEVPVEEVEAVEEVPVEEVEAADDVSEDEDSEDDVSGDEDSEDDVSGDEDSEDDVSEDEDSEEKTSDEE